MSGQYLNTLTENASRLGMRIQESFSEHTRDLTVGRGSVAYLDADDKSKLLNIRKQLDSNSDREKLDAMKRLVALISKGRNVSEYFAQVVKNVASQNLEIRKLVYIYLLRYAEQEPDLALLSINTFQKDLADSNPLIRAMALRVLSGIRVPMIGSIVVLAIKKCAADPSPYVRKAAALAIPKCYELDSSHLPALIQIITTLLRDRSPPSLGGVALAFAAVCPTRFDLLHLQYRRLCKILPDVDEWGQVELMNLLLRYARVMLPRRDEEELDKDLQLLLTSTESVCYSRNPAVVLAATRVFYYGAPTSQLPKIVHPLLRLLNTSPEVERVVVVYLLVITKSAPGLFAPFYSRFLVRSDDFPQLKKDKIKLLLNVLSVDNYQTVLREFIDYADDTNDEVVAEAIRALGRCARQVPDSVQHCLTALISMIKSPHDVVVSNAVLVLKYLVQTQLDVGSSSVARTSQSPLSIISHLARRIDDIKHAQARACILWLVGQYGSSNSRDGVAEWAPDVLRKTAKTFGDEAPLVKLQIVTLAAKLFIVSPTDRTLGLLSRYVFSLARYDMNYDVRDRARMVTSLLVGVAPNSLVNGDEQPEERSGVVLRREQIRLVLFEGKSGVVNDEPSHLDGTDDENVMIGTVSVITDKPMRMDDVLPDWLERGVESSLRDSEDDAPPLDVPMALSSGGKHVMKGVLTPPVVLTPSGGSSPRTGGAWRDLDSFYADAEEESEDEEEEDGDDEEDDEEEEEEEEEEESEAEEEESQSEGERNS
ncbi:hypothetical protein K443DRAFT_126976 [Laccaria amethystina LaAM-08-1]|uniref:Clathrin/coatomer adaptor adaptin-like N-terminal domain-containing protein n=1 Tax=Laccaria amethystina LaAM-08-1 TaxID=1095629 RepID=A0A0C9YQ74_9AGAR|nr:hypothetical protein K443DRAFT_126976 [Laccaria amethystina LaAM-08-1]